MNEVFNFLKNKSQNYSKIDKFRAFRIYEKYKNKFQIKPIIHIVGTNGKGSTGRFLAQLLEGLNFKVGHFTSPHIFSFNERFYMNGEIASDLLLEKAHCRLKNILKEDLFELSYFEYATFLALLLFEKCDFVIFEAGLGGEYDATSVFEKRLSIFTKIGFDHMQILGNSLEQIARTKLKVMAKQAVSSNEQKNIVLNLALKIAKIKGSDLIFLKNNFDTDIENEIFRYKKIHKLPDFLVHNLRLALQALIILLNSKKQAFIALKKLECLNLRGRLEQINPNLYIDVGHNEMAAKALLQTFEKEKIILIFNSFSDKNFFSILRILKPIIDTIEIYFYKNCERKLANMKIYEAAKILELRCKKFKKIEKEKKYLVFGSFTLVEHFLKEIFEK